MNLMECNICCETVNGHNRPIECGFCDFSACSRCTERYLLDIHDDAHCMSCRKGWDIGILTKNMTQTFLKTKYRKHRKDTLLDREKSLLPQTQPDVEHTLATRENKKLLDSMLVRRCQLLEELREVKHTITELQYTRNVVRETGGDGNVTTRKCPMDACRGFLTRNWKCGICETQICKDCNEEKGEDHQCDAGNVETMNLLKKDSKPCPSCGTLITKIDGCDQMWCTQPSCHTAFSWRTGKKVFGTIHNPHFIQFSMQNGTVERNPQDIPCGGLPDVYTFFGRVRHYSRYHPDGSKIFDAFSHPIRGLRHLVNVEEYHYRVTDVRDTNTDLRVRYLLNEIDDDTFAKTIIARDTALKKKKAFHDIIVMTMHTGSDIINMLDNLLSTKHTCLSRYDVKAIDTQVTTIEKLRLYANAHFSRVSQMYNYCKYPHIDSDWEFKRFV